MMEFWFSSSAKCARTYFHGRYPCKRLHLCIFQQYGVSLVCDCETVRKSTFVLLHKSFAHKTELWSLFHTYTRCRLSGSKEIFLKLDSRYENNWNIHLLQIPDLENYLLAPPPKTLLIPGTSHLNSTIS